jgi:hypothetical protein
MTRAVDWYRTRAARYGQQAADFAKLHDVIPYTHAAQDAAIRQLGDVAREAAHYGRLVLLIEEASRP